MTSSQSRFDNYVQYLRNTYGLDWPVLLEPIEDFANIKTLFSDDRKYLLTTFGYTEASLNFDELREMIRRELRKNDSLFQRDEGLAFIRLCILVTMFDRDLNKAPDNNDDFKQYCLNHPLWPRIE